MLWERSSTVTFRHRQDGNTKFAKYSAHLLPTKMNCTYARDGRSGRGDHAAAGSPRGFGPGWNECAGTTAEAPSTRAGAGRWGYGPTAARRIHPRSLPCVRGVCFKRNETKRHHQPAPVPVDGLRSYGWSPDTSSVAPVCEGALLQTKRNETAFCSLCCSYS